MATESTDISSKALSAVTIKRICLLLALMLVPVLIGLGFWQLQRAEQKQQLIDRAQVESLNKFPAIGQPVFLPQTVLLDARLEAEQYWLLDNRTRDGRVGYELLMPFEDQASKQWGIVNLGWLEAASDRSWLPELRFPASLSEQSVKVRGVLVSAEAGYQIGVDRWQAGWPKRIQQPDLLRFEQLTGRSFYPAILRLQEPVSVPVLVDLDPRWQLVNMQPQQHLGYAVQWFGLALALSVWLCWFGWWRSTSGRNIPAAAPVKSLSAPETL